LDIKTHKKESNSLGGSDSRKALPGVFPKGSSPRPAGSTATRRGTSSSHPPSPLPCRPRAGHLRNQTQHGARSSTTMSTTEGLTQSERWLYPNSECSYFSFDFTVTADAYVMRDCVLTPLAMLRLLPSRLQLLVMTDCQAAPIARLWPPQRVEIFPTQKYQGRRCAPTALVLRTPTSQYFKQYQYFSFSV